MDKNIKDEDKAKKIIAEVDALFHTSEKSNPEGVVTYLDVLRIGDRVREHFDRVPRRIEGALEVAAGLCNPNKIAGVNSITKGLGAIIASGGGMALMYGVVTVIVSGVSVAAPVVPVATGLPGIFVAVGGWFTGHAAVTAVVTTILWTGPVGIAVGVASLATGIFFIIRQVSPKMRAMLALDVVRKAVAEWGRFSSLAELPDLKWVTKLSSEEYKALLSLMWLLANADEKLAQEEIRLIEKLLTTRRPDAMGLAVGEGIMELDSAARLLRCGKHVKNSAKLLRTIINCDNVVTPEEERAWAEIAEKLEIEA